jgi:hypothetical protein
MSRSEDSVPTVPPFNHSFHNLLVLDSLNPIEIPSNFLESVCSQTNDRSNLKAKESEGYCNVATPVGLSIVRQSFVMSDCKRPEAGAPWNAN